MVRLASKSSPNWPCSAAICTGVEPSISLLQGLCFSSINLQTVAVSPATAAWCSGELLVGAVEGGSRAITGVLPAGREANHRTRFKMTKG